MYEYALARRLKALGSARSAPAWYLAACVSTDPLTFTALDGNARFVRGEGLTLTATAAAREWRTGDKAAALLSGTGLLVIDRVQA